MPDVPEGTHLVTTPAAASMRVQRLLLEVVGGPDAGQRLVTSADRITVGHAPGNTLTLTDPTVSRFHLELSHEADGRVRVRDLGSTNRTRVNGVGVLEAELPDEATLRLGGTAVRFARIAEEEEIALSPEPAFGRLHGASRPMRALFAELERLAATSATVLIEGESGTGKELVAEALHARSPRAGKPFVVVDCGSIPAELVESELFGHERGAFTGASAERRGAFEAADGGTLFLDEIGELPLSVQPKLLRALERRQVKRVGSDRHRPVDVRFIAATHRELRRMVNQGQFREDLYFRLAVAVVRLPPLRERLEDLPLLLEHLWNDTFAALGVAPRPYQPPSAETLASLQALPWDGNVRELRNFVERSVALSGALDVSRLRAMDAQGDVAPAVRTDLPYKDAKRLWVEHFERAYLAERLERAGGNVSQLSREAELDRAHLISLLKKYAVR